MKNILLFFFFISTAFAGKGQNLVPNGDFEQYSACPTNTTQIEKALFWFNPTVSMWQGGAESEYFNHCSTICPGVCVPENQFGFQYARSGDGYAGIYLLAGGNYKEYIETPLQSPLVAGNCYYFEMYVSLSRTILALTTDDIAVYFSDSAVTGINNPYPLPFIPQINNNNGNYFDTLNWTLVSGYYTASGNENHLLIGNFKSDSNTTIVPPIVCGEQFYVYIDDVSLIPCTATSIQDQNQNQTINIYPNPVKDQLNISGLPGEEKQIIITDILGKEIYRTTPLTSDFRLPTSNFKEGIYFIEINTGKEIFRKKFLKE